ncbi:hypothetical protein niasHS_001756 [Heterodera schachtii]|uniref:Uncharacterized protein n=1 Tax=Heterodera schachtii TaxID=97005 RepID=A0ABD2KC76_HETSC
MNTVVITSANLSDQNFVSRRKSLFADRTKTVHCLPTFSSTCSASLTILPADERVGTKTQIFVPHVADRTTTFVEPFLQMGLSNMNQEVELLSKLSAAASQSAASISFICPNSAASSKVSCPNGPTNCVTAAHEILRLR